MRHETNDPIHPGDSASAEDLSSYKETITVYLFKWISRYDDLDSLTNVHLWGDFIEDFSETTIRNLEGDNLSKLRNCLNKHSVYVQGGRGINRVKALLTCLNADSCPRDPSLSSSSPDEEQSDKSGKEIPESGTEKSAKDDSKESAFDEGTAQDKTTDPPENGSKSAGKKSSLPDGGKRNSSNSGSSAPASSKGLSDLTKAMSGHTKFSGQYDEDLLEAITVYEVACDMCNLTEEQMLKGISCMLSGDAMFYYSANLRHFESYEELKDGLKAWYTSDEKRARLLREWQGARLSSWFQKSPEKSQTAVFRMFCAYLSRIQRQLHSDYKPDRFLKDQIVLSTDIPNVSRALRERPPNTSHEAIQRIAALLSDEYGSANSHISMADNLQVNYSLGKRLGGQAERPFRSTRNNRDKSKTRSERQKLAKVKGCWVCGEDHPARKFHSPEEVDAAINRLRNSKAYVAIEDAVSIFTAEVDDNDSLSESDSESSEGEAMASVAEEICHLNEEMEQRLSNQCFYHSCGFNSRRKDEMKKMEVDLKATDNRQEFNGAMVDIGANYMSMMSLAQYQAYCREFSIPAAIFKYEARTVKGIGGRQRCFGSVNIPVAFDSIGVVIEITFHITETDTPTILCLRDLKRTGFQIDIQKDCLSFMGRDEKLENRNGLLWHQWYPSVAHFSEVELKRLHRSFGHPSVSALYKVLRRARPNEVNESTRIAIEQLTKDCDPCSRNAAKPKRFKLTTGSEDSRFNHVVAADIMYIDGKPILHVVDEATHFASATWLRRVTSAEVWEAFTRSWSNVYMGPPDFLKVDQGTQFVSKEFKASVQFSGIELLEAPIESPATMSHVERYHGPLRTAFQKLQAGLPEENSTNLLQMAVHCVNSTVGPEGLCPCLCVFGAIPSPIRHVPAPSQVSRAQAIDIAMNEVQRHHAKTKVQFALRYRGPFGKERDDLDKLPFGSQVLVYRETTSKWEGPFKFIFKDGETVCLELGHGRRIFRSNVVKPYTSSSDYSQERAEVHAALQSFDEYQPDYISSRRKELDGLIQQGVFKVVDRASLPKNTRIFGSRFVDEMKTRSDGREYEKSRLVARHFRDKKAKKIPTKAPTISRMGQRVCLALIPCDEKKRSFLRDVIQAFIQAKYKLGRRVYLEPVAEMNLPPGMVLSVERPLYGVPEAALYWYLTYREHHVEDLGMNLSTVDQCIMYRRDPDSIIPNMTVLQVDDTLGCGSESFFRDEELYSTKFMTKPRELLEIGKSVKFNGARITLGIDQLKLSQSDKIRKLKVPTTMQEASSQRASIQYISTISRPDISSTSQLLAADISSKSPDAVKSVAELVRHCQATKDIALNFPKLDVSDLRIVLLSDAAFANAEKCNSQTGFVILLVDKHDTASIVHYGSSKCTRVARSVMAAELLALVFGFDHAFVVQYLVKELLGRLIPIDIYIDSRTAFNCVGKDANTTEKRLQIDAASVRQAIRRGEIRNIGWIPGTENPADGMTRKKLPNEAHPLSVLMRTNKFKVKPNGWISNDLEKAANVVESDHNI